MIESYVKQLLLYSIKYWKTNLMIVNSKKKKSLKLNHYIKFIVNGIFTNAKTRSCCKERERESLLNSYEMFLIKLIPRIKILVSAS